MSYLRLVDLGLELTTLFDFEFVPKVPTTEMQFSKMTSKTRIMHI